jgi:hypothetical protein
VTRAAKSTSRSCPRVKIFLAVRYSPFWIKQAWAKTSFSISFEPIILCVRGADGSSRAGHPRKVKLRAGVRERMEHSPLCDAKTFTRDLEAAYREMWRTWCGRQQPG